MANGRGWRYPEIFRRMAVEPFKCCENIEWLAKELGVPCQTSFSLTVHPRVYLSSHSAFVATDNYVPMTGDRLRFG